MKPLGDSPEEGGYIVAVVDITDLKAAESSQRHAAEEAKERKEQQERFVDMISHEIRVLFMSIMLRCYCYADCSSRILYQLSSTAPKKSERP